MNLWWDDGVNEVVRKVRFGLDLGSGFGSGFGCLDPGLDSGFGFYSQCQYIQTRTPSQRLEIQQIAATVGGLLHRTTRLKKNKNKKKAKVQTCFRLKPQYTGKIWFSIINPVLLICSLCRCLSLAMSTYNPWADDDGGDAELDNPKVQEERNAKLANAMIIDARANMFEPNASDEIPFANCLKACAHTLKNQVCFVPSCCFLSQ